MENRNPFLEFKQIDLFDSNNIDFDIVIFGLGYEKRSSYLAKKYDFLPKTKKYCLSLLEGEETDEFNDFKKNNFEIVNYTDDKKLDNLLSQITDYFLKSEKKGIVLIDYSIMMKVMYSKFLEFFIYQLKKDFDLYFIYVHAKYEEPKKTLIPNEKIYPISFKSSINDISNSNNLALITSLGYEKSSPIGIAEYLEIGYENIYAFINNDPGSELQNIKSLELNKEFLSQLLPSNIYSINFSSFVEVVAKMDSIISSLNNKDVQIILAPLGKKTFSLLGMFYTLIHKNIIYYNVTSGRFIHKYKKEPSNEKEPLVYLCRKRENN